MNIFGRYVGQTGWNEHELKGVLVSLRSRYVA